MILENSLRRGSQEVEIIRKWYRKLHFSNTYDTVFKKMLVDTEITIKEEFTDNAKENFLTALYRCEELEQKYVCYGIDSRILLETLSDVVIWTEVWYDLTGQLGLMEVEWLKHHFSFQLFRLGRLQFCMNRAEHGLSDKRISEGTPVIEVHIPAGLPLDIEECKVSINAAKVFFEKYFPQHKYEYFICHSWLLDKTLEKFLDKKSNILEFQKLFNIVQADQSDAILKYIFRWDAVREKISQYEAKTKLAAKVKEYVVRGGILYEAYGIFDKD